MALNDELQKIERLKPNPFIDGPGDFLAKHVAAALAADERWKFVFGQAIYPYERGDLSMRELPALRIYSPRYRKEHESHYITGDLMIDCVFPASVRRAEHQEFQDVVSSAIVQQFRRPSFFDAMRAVVPGLNELGKTLDVDKSLGLALSDQSLVPLTHMTANFRLDLKEWDAYLEEQGRTKDRPFEVTLSELRSIVASIQGVTTEEPAEEGATSFSGDEVKVTVPVQQKPGEPPAEEGA